MNIKIPLNDFSWVDGDGSLHLDIPAMLRKMNVDDTEANRAEATQAALEYFNRMLPKTSLVVVSET